MGMSRSAVPTCGVLLTFILGGACFADSGVTLQQHAWPAKSKCEKCVTIQFDRLEMRLPLAEIGKILVIRGESNLFVLPPSSADKKASVDFLAMPRSMLLGRYRKLGLLKGFDVRTNEQFFDLLGMQPDTKALEILRELQGVAVAKRYIKMSKRSVHVYWIQSPLPGGSQKVYFVIDGDDMAYLLTGNVTARFLDAALSNLKIANVP